MGVFGRNSNTTAADILVYTLFVLVLIQAVGLLFSNTEWGANIKLGPVFILAMVVMCVGLVMAFIKRMLNDLPITKADMFTGVIVIGLTILMLFFLKDFVPDIFAESVIQLQSMVFN